MTRLLFLAICFTSALATMDTMAKNDMAGNNMGGNSMNSDMGQKNAMDMSSGSKAVGVSVKVISSYKGGNAPVEQVSQPTMAQGTMHKVRSYANAPHGWNRHLHCFPGHSRR